MPRFIRETLIVIVSVILLVVGIGAVLQGNTDFEKAVDLKPAVGDRAIGLFSVYVAISLAIESTIEIYLKAFRDNSSESVPKTNSDSPGDDADTETKSSPKSNNKRIATITSLIIGVAISFAGVRFLEPFFEINSLEGYQVQLFHALDILLTAGLLSGGSDGIHQVT
ncbi:MAG: hypothetical protein AAGA16_20370, partial [Cyanobacteria bacterium P01_E01_bin.35]